MSHRWTPKDVAQIMAVSTGCLCLLIIVLVVTLGVYNGRITTAVLGSVTSASAATGLLGLALIVYRVIRLTLVGNKNEN